MRNVTVLASLCLTACGGGYTPAQVAPPPEISIEKAFAQAANGLVDFRRTLALNDTSLGLIVCKIDVNFNISAKATAKGEAGIDIAVPLEVAKIGANAFQQNTSVGNRGNVVQITLNSIYPALCGRPGAATAANSEKSGEEDAAKKPGGRDRSGGKVTTGPDTAAANEREEANKNHQVFRRLLQLQQENLSLRNLGQQPTR